MLDNNAGVHVTNLDCCIFIVEASSDNNDPGWSICVDRSNTFLKVFPMGVHCRYNDCDISRVENWLIGNSSRCVQGEAHEMANKA